MQEKKQNIRPKTKREKELESKPPCLCDPLEQLWCNHHTYPPPKKQCESCIIQSIADALEYRTGSEAMRWFIAYMKLLKEE